MRMKHQHQRLHKSPPHNVCSTIPAIITPIAIAIANTKHNRSTHGSKTQSGFHLLFIIRNPATKFRTSKSKTSKKESFGHASQKLHTIIQQLPRNTPHTQQINQPSNRHRQHKHRIKPHSRQMPIHQTTHKRTNRHTQINTRIIRTIRNTTALAACDYHGLRLRD